jgi:hypothetical protein
MKRAISVWPGEVIRVSRQAVVSRIAPVVAASIVALLGQAVLADFASAQSAFGIASFEAGTSTAQAGAHADLTVGFTLNTNMQGEPTELLKDVNIRLPAGTVGNPLAIPRCTSQEFEIYGCQPSSQVGIISIDVSGASKPAPIAIYNLTPTPGHLAAFAASLLFVKIVGEIEMSKSGSYELVLKIHDLSTAIPIVGASLTLWGVPGAHAHDLERSRTQIEGPKPIYGPPNEFGETEIIGIEPTPAGVAPTALLTNPTDCSGPPLKTKLDIDSWENPDPKEPITREAGIPGPSGCDALRMSPSIAVIPDTTQQDTPAGYDIDVSNPQNEEPYELGTPSLRKATITLPVGTSLSPGVAAGLVPCSDAQFAANDCPNASKVGTAAIATPLLTERLTGAIYIGVPNETAMYRIFVSASVEGVAFRLSGVAHLDPNTGQVSVAFEEIPGLPFSFLELHLFGGPGAMLANPEACGPATTISELLSYGGQSAEPASSFNVDSNGSGGACPSTRPFAPGFVAGTMSALTGGSSPLSLTVLRSDGQQTLSTVTAQLPPGLVGMLSQVPPCSEPQASRGSCPQVSQIGSITMGVGAGAQPVHLSGSVYLTGAYDGAPFGLAIVVPATIGPFDLGTAVIRAQILVSPTDMHLTIISGPLPQVLGGIPLRLRSVTLTIDRPGFIVNPTGCEPQIVAASIGSAEGMSAAVSNPFQVDECHSLPFAPRLRASTHAGASRRGNGAGLDVSVVNSGGGGANIRTLIVELPKQLGPRLTTIEQACRAAAFFADPGTCPASSLVGKATVMTPVLSTPLSGPVYLVASGGAGYPELSMILRSQGVSIDVGGAVDISRQRVVSAAFRMMPDIPIGSFELALSRGPHSMLGASANLCAGVLSIPYTITAQNNAQIRGTTTVSVAGCRAHTATGGSRESGSSHGHGGGDTSSRASFVVRSMKQGDGKG